MKNNSKLILLLTVIGFLVLVASAFYFGAPLFGWIVVVAIFAIFLGSQWRDFKLMKQIEKEREVLKAHSNGLILDKIEPGIVGDRIAVVKRLAAHKVPFSSQLVTEILDVKATVQVGRSMGGVVVLLGLLGTFFGLMLAVSTAGAAIDNSTTQNTLDSIQSIFSSMKGIFGTSLCGLFSALVLNASHALVEKENSDFVSDLDKFTLLELIPTFSVQEKSSDSHVHELMAALAENMQKNQEATLASISETFISLQKESVQSITQVTQNQSKSLEEFLSQMQKNWSSMEHFASDEIKKSIQQMASTFAETISGQVNALKEQSNAFIQSLKEESLRSSQSFASSMEATQAKQLEGVEHLRSIASRVIEKTEVDASAFSSSIQKEFGALAEKIGVEFSQLTESSSALAEVQKRLVTDVESRTTKELEAADVLANNISEAATLMRVNQSEFAANLEVLRRGLETVIEKLSGDTAEHEDENNFMEQLQASLQAFHERASEVLMENAVKTQEILLEVLEQAQRVSAASNVKSEG